MARRILLVDDEAPLLHLVENFLTRNGYEVEAFVDPSEALARFESDVNRYHLVIADLTMPELSGDQLVTRLGELSATVHMLLLSGAIFSTERFPEQLRARVAFLQKPFLPRMLLESVSQLEARIPRDQAVSDSTC
jgi:DNA-binding response OmpR family regulator